MATFYVLDHTPHFDRKKIREAEAAHAGREDKKAMRKLWDEGRESKGRPRKAQPSDRGGVPSSARRRGNRIAGLIQEDHAPDGRKVK